MNLTDEFFEHLNELKPFKIEFTDVDDKYHQVNCTAKKVSEDYILLSPPGEILPDLEDNAAINLIIPKTNSILTAQCSFLEKEINKPYGIKISYPYNIEVHERREYIRVSLHLRVQVTCTFGGNLQEKENFYTKTRNISGSGLCFLSEKSLEGCDDNIQCKIYLNDGNSEPVSVKCNYVYSRKVKVKNNILYMSALSYRSISEEDSARIVKECFKYQIRHKHAELG